MNEHLHSIGSGECPQWKKEVNVCLAVAAFHSMRWSLQQLSSYQHTVASFQRSSRALMEDNLRLWVGNLPYVAQKVDLENLFSSNGISV